MRLDIVTPERQLISAEVSSVRIPGVDGDMTVMGAHAPTVTTLRPGIVSVSGGDAAGEFVVTGGFAEISSDGASILAERAVPKSEATREMLESMLADAKAAADIAEESAKAAARMRVNDVTELMKVIG
ncbi:ATP synthase F1 subunit epsilon [Halovulum dunhuangense]|uniref:ATP synthase epsilon chain n=1 Tax=Halovulum dunhuangense TaxID=1505036 RepID=A0A849KYV2_9RHOB|nr:ATP synthase F1 subunit epsilon [Halovulum dunhuangense]NNU79516.1 ATP synthase F1 subunit epsilon [Halovulum dunhuangense]